MSPTGHSVLDVAGVQSAHIHAMWNVLMYVCGAMYLFVIVFLAWALVRGRRAREIQAPGDSAGITFALRGWIGIVIVALFGLTIASYAADRALYVAAQSKGLTLKVSSLHCWRAI